MRGITEPEGLENSIPNGHSQNSTPGVAGMMFHRSSAFSKRPSLIGTPHHAAPS